MTDRPNSHADLGPLGIGSDAARRIAENYNLHVMATGGTHGQWMAFRLDDGTCDPTLYDHKADAIGAKGLFAKHWGYAKIMPGGMSIAAAESYLRTCRQVADNPNLRWRQTDPDAPSEHLETLVMPMRKELLR